MLKLLLNSEREKIKHEYTMRFVNVFLVFVLMILLMTGIFMVAPHILVNVEEEVVDQELDALANSDTSKQKATIDDMRKKVNAEYEIFSQPYFSPSALLSPILKNQIEGISINSVSFNKVDEKDAANIDADSRGEKLMVDIELRGLAASRSTLVEFQKKLETAEEFVNVQVPLSNLTKDVDVAFTVMIKAEIDPVLKQKENE